MCVCRHRMSVANVAQLKPISASFSEVSPPQNAASPRCLCPSCARRADARRISTLQRSGLRRRESKPIKIAGHAIVSGKLNREPAKKALYVIPDMQREFQISKWQRIRFAVSQPRRVRPTDYSAGGCVERTLRTSNPEMAAASDGHYSATQSRTVRRSSSGNVGAGSRRSRGRRVVKRRPVYDPKPKPTARTDVGAAPPGHFDLFNDFIDFGWQRRLKPTQVTVFNSLLRHRNNKTGLSRPGVDLLTQEATSSRRQTQLRVAILGKGGLVGCGSPRWRQPGD